MPNQTNAPKRRVSTVVFTTKGHAVIHRPMKPVDILDKAYDLGGEIIDFAECSFKNNSHERWFKNWCRTKGQQYRKEATNA